MENLIKNLEKYLQLLNVKQLYENPDHKNSKNWLAEVTTVLKMSGRHSYKEFKGLSQHIYPSIPLETRKHAAEQIDVLMRQIIAQYRKEYSASRHAEVDKIDDKKEKVPFNKKSRGVKLLCDPYFIVAVLALLVGLISIPWWPYILQQVKTSNIKNQQNPSSLTKSNDTLSGGKLGFVRALESLETGKKISELPNGVYFFSTPVGIEYEIENIGVDFIKASGFSNGYKFEIQKFKNRYYLIGFVSDETRSNLSSANSAKPLSAILYPNSWGGATHAIAIPFDMINAIDYRDIEQDAKTKITVFDIEFKEVIDNPEIHR